MENLGPARLVLAILAFAWAAATAEALRLAAYISSGGLHGEIRFESSGNGGGVKIRLALKPTLQYPDQLWHWSLTEFPVDYTVLENRCSQRYLGKSVIDLTKLVGPLGFPGNETGSIEVPSLSLSGEKGLWGKGILLKDPIAEKAICASITVRDKNAEKIAEAKFHGSIAGSVWFRWLGGQGGEDTTDTIIYADLQHTADQKSEDLITTEHRWKIYVTDIFDSKERSSCNILQTVFDPNDADPGKSIGDVDERLGKINISSHASKSFFRDPELALLHADLLGPHRVLYLVIFHPTHEDLFLACAQIRPRRQTIAKSIVNSHGVKGEVTLVQESPFYPTWVNVSLAPINDLETRLRYNTKVASYRIHELPREPDKYLHDPVEPCSTTKELYDPLDVHKKGVPPPGLGTQDQYAIGDLSGKLQGRKEGSDHLDILPGSSKLQGLYWDTYLPLTGINSVSHRSLVVHKYNETDARISAIPWFCGTFALQMPQNAGQMPMITAEVIYRYPLVGRIIFRQPKHDPEMDTTIIVEHLIHADGSSLNDSVDHRWMIHDNPPGKDYYNWTARCLSAGAPYNPYKIEWKADHPEHCSGNDVAFCRMGDLTRHGTLNIAGRKLDGSRLTRKLFTDPMIKLTGAASIIGKSLVIYDDHGPKARGERLACSIIDRTYRRKAVAKDWFGNGEDSSSIGGKLEFIQESAYDVTDVEVNIEGLNGKMSGYHVHETPVEIDLEFPCEGTSLYGHWNPLKVDPSLSPPPTTGTSDQYEMGDLSGKFGTLDGRRRYMSVYNDTMLPLFGPRSILGRSIVVHKKDKNARYACTTIERGYAPGEARELRAIASFHHPQGYAYGYVRMTQLVYNDDSKSDTVIEVNLRHPGKHDRNVTRNHNWAIWVNPVGVDAIVKTQLHRCVAGGYIWNPYFTQLADPLNEDLYKQECGPDLPLRCYVGDVSARVGPIDLGAERRVIVDSNFPLEGTVSAMGKSIVIYDKDFGGNRFACANIEPDNDIVKYANIRKPPRFVAAQFLDDVRQVMGIPEWMLSIDSRKTKILHNGACIQFLMHFKGPLANRLEQDFGRLMSTGKLDTPSLSIPGYVPSKRKNTLGHRQCGFHDPNEKRADKNLPFYYGSTASGLTPTFVCIWSLLFAVKFM